MSLYMGLTTGLKPLSCTEPHCLYYSLQASDRTNTNLSKIMGLATSLYIGFHIFLATQSTKRSRHTHRPTKSSTQILTIGSSSSQLALRLWKSWSRVLTTGS